MYINNIILKGIFLIFPLIHFFWIYNVFSLPKILFLSIGVFLLCCLSIISFFQNKNHKLPKMSIYLFSGLVIFILFLVVWLLNSQNIYSSLYWTIDRYFWLFSYITIFIYFFFLALHIEKKHIIDYFKIIALSWFIASLFWIIYSLAWINYEWRIIGTIGQYNIFWLYLLTPLLLSLYIFFEKNIKKYLIYAIIIFIAILLTKSRVSFALAFIWLIFVSYLYYTKIQGIKRYILIISIIIITIFSWVFYYNRLKINQENIWSIKSRIMLFDYWLNTIKDSNISSLIFWNWIESQRDLLIKYLKPDIYLYEKVWFLPDKVHNLVIDSIIEYWFLGTFIYLAIFLFFPFILFYQKKNKDKIDKIIIFIILSIFIWNLVGFNYPIILFINLFFVLYFTLDDDKIWLNKVLLKSIVVVFTCLSLFISIWYAKELDLNYKVNWFQNNLDYQKTIINSKNEEIKQKIFLELFKTNNYIIEWLLKDFEKSNDQLSLHYALFYYVNSENKDFKKIKEITNNLLLVYPYNIYWLKILSDICYYENNYDCFRNSNNKIFSSIPKIMYQSNYKLTNFEIRKKTALLDFMWINDLDSEKEIFQKKLDYLKIK